MALLYRHAYTFAVSRDRRIRTFKDLAVAGSHNSYIEVNKIYTENAKREVHNNHTKPNWLNDLMRQEQQTVKQGKEISLVSQKVTMQKLSWLCILLRIKELNHSQYQASHLPNRNACIDRVC